jgi:hypothetical protein
MAAPNEPLVPLRHGTTRQRAEAIRQHGPDAGFVEPGGLDRADGFSTCPAAGPYPVGSPSDYARGKARLFPNEGGPAVLEVEVPESIVRLGIDAGGEVRFQPGYGLEELLDAWPALPKRVLPA